MPLHPWSKFELAILLVGLLGTSLQGCGISRSEDVPTNASGAFDVAWLEAFGTSENDIPFQIAAGSAQRVTLAGATAGSPDFGDGVLTPDNGFAPFVVELDSSGKSLFSMLARATWSSCMARSTAAAARAAITRGRRTWPPALRSVPNVQTVLLRLRPAVVFFDEFLSVDAERAAKRALRRCDLFLAVGTSGTVSPASNYVRAARFEGARTVYVNLEPMAPPNPEFQETVLGPADEVLPKLLGVTV